ncbi:MAG TPA: PadR family transcriptional regulator [Stellaceae bacterium]|nr:PadR family transcriptional regulator [Stellaceae bacterium]
MHHRCEGGRGSLAGLMFAIGRHGFGRGRGFRGGFMGGFGGDGFPPGRKLGQEDLQLLLLALIADRPSHGYELIKALEERSNGFYSPSPGMIYPALTYLEEIGYATVEADGAKKLYRISEAGSAFLAEHRSRADQILGKLQAIGQRMEQVRRAFAGETGDEEDGVGPDDYRQARRDLKHALHERRPGTPEEAKRIAEILRRAASEIRKG